MIFPVVDRLAVDGFPVRESCRLLRVSPSGFYDWRNRPPSQRDRDDAVLLEHIAASHRQSRGTYGARRVHADLRLGLGIRCGRKRVERLMRHHALVGVTRRRPRGCTIRNPDAQPSDDLVERRFTARAVDQLWVADITQQPTGEGWVYLAVVIDACSRRVVGWSIADHLRSELVVDALEMALWRRRPAPGSVVHHSDHGTQYTSWAFGQRLRQAGLLGSMGTIGDCFDNALAESFFATVETELLDRTPWATRAGLAAALFDYIERFYNPHRRHSSLGYLSPIDYETALAAPAGVAA
jgi:putative transposase